MSHQFFILFLSSFGPTDFQLKLPNFYPTDWLKMSRFWRKSKIAFIHVESDVRLFMSLMFSNSHIITTLLWRKRIWRDKGILPKIIQFGLSENGRLLNLRKKCY